MKVHKVAFLFIKDICYLYCLFLNMFWIVFKQVTTMLLVPPIVNMFIKDSRVFNFDISTLRNIFCGGAPLCSETSGEFCRRIGVTIRQG